MSNFKKVVLVIVLLGLVVMVGFVYFVYMSVFIENIMFNNDVVYIYIFIGVRFSDVFE